MGSSVRDKHLRTLRRARSSRPDSDSCSRLDGTGISKSALEPSLESLNYNLEVTRNPNPNADRNINDQQMWGCCTEEQLELIFLKHLQHLYNEAVSKLVALGYDEEIALKAILHNGHCYGGMDVPSNIFHNSLAYLNTTCSSSSMYSEESKPVFADVRQLVEYSTAAMVCLLQQVSPQISKGDALWCLLKNDLHVGRATTMVVTNKHSIPAINADIPEDDKVAVVDAPICRFHGGSGFAYRGSLDLSTTGLSSYAAEINSQRNIECPERFNLSPAMKSLLNRNVAAFAAGYQSNSKRMVPGNVPQLVSGVEIPTEKHDDGHKLKNKDIVNVVTSKFSDMNLEENAELSGEDQKDDIIWALLHQIRDLRRQVKERKEWAHQKAMQAAKKLNTDLKELKMFKMEREETQELKNGKPTLGESTMKRLSEMENSLRKASGQVDQANAAVRRLETENAEIKAEMEAAKLNESESAKLCSEVEKREKKFSKRLLAWERQKCKLQHEIADEKKKVKELQKGLATVEQVQKELEAKWKQEMKAKDLALMLVEEERRSKEAAETSGKRKLDALRLKIDIDFQRLKDDLQRLEQEHSHLRLSAQLTVLPSGKSDGTGLKGKTIASLLHELDILENSCNEENNSERKCIICNKDEVSVVFLPCAHQVICVSCSDCDGKKGTGSCPCCRVPIEQRIHVFGASS